MESLLLEATERSSGTKAKALRKTGRVPAVFYGKGQKNMDIDVDLNSFRRVFDKAGENTVIHLAVGAQKLPVLVYDVQYDPVSDVVAHIDFIHVDMQKEVTTSVKVVAVGIAPAVKNLGGNLDIMKHEIKIRCLPKDLIHKIEVDVSPIVDFHTSIHVKDLKLPSAIKVLDNPEDTVATATPPRAEEETAPTEAATPEGAVAGAAAPAGAAPAPGAPAAAAAPAGKEAKK